MQGNALDIIDRQTVFILRREEPGDFLVEISAYLQTLEQDSTLAAHMADLRREASELESAYAKHDEDLIGGLVAIREEFAARAADHNDSEAEPTKDRYGFPSHDWEWTLANFDRIARDEASGRPRADDPTRVGALIGILLSKLDGARHPMVVIEGEPQRQQEDQRPDLDDLARQVGNINRSHEHFLQSIRLRTRTSPGVGLVRLEAVEESINPTPVIIEDQEDQHAYLEWAIRFSMSPGLTLAKAVQGEQLDRAGETVLADEIVKLRLNVERLSEELRRRVGTTASRLALIRRFKLRAEWHDRDRLVEVAAASPGRSEDRLTAELARFLFDQGLSPITKPLLGRLEPDLLDPSVRPSVYVEAKQYVNANNARRNLIRAVAQVHDTVGGLIGSPFECHEAFLVVFRRGGPRYTLPASLPGDGWTTYLILIDIADPEERGSRALRKPVQLRVDDFLD